VGLYAEEFHVAGRLEVSRPRDVSGIEVDTFDVFFRSNTWNIQIHQVSYPEAPKDAVLFDYVSYNSDSDVFTAAYPTAGSLQRIISNPKAPSAWKEHPDRQAFNLAWIDRSIVPYADLTPGLSALFYAFCSGDYLARAGNGYLEPPYFVDGQINSYCEGATNVPAKYSTNGFKPYLPVRIDFLHSDKLLLSNGVWVDAPKELIGYTNAIFNAYGFKNVNGVSIPSTFNLTVISPTFTNRNIGFSTTLQLRGYVLDATATCELTNLRPPLAGPAVFADKRFTSDGSRLVVQYVSSNWLPERDVRQSKDFEAAKLQHYVASRNALVQAAQTGDRRPRLLSLVVLVVAVLSAIPMLLWRRKLPKRSPK
jgi:hypothetical protein